MNEQHGKGGVTAADQVHRQAARLELAALVELDIKVEVFNPVLFVFLNRTRSQVKILYWERNGFCLWLKRLEAERFKTKPDAGDEAIELTVDELNWLLDGIDLWRNRPHQILTPRFVT